MLASYARKWGVDRVEILDCEAEDLTPEVTAKRIIDRQPKLAAIVVYGHQPSASTQNMTMAEAIVRAVDCSVPMALVGGHVASLPHDTASRVAGRAVAVGGEGFVALIDILHGAAVVGMEYPLIDHVPRVAYDLMDPTRYRAHNYHALTGPRTPYASIYASLGCPYRCTFCCIQAPFKGGRPAAGPGANTYRVKDVSIVIDEIDWLVDNWGAHTIRFDDEMFGVNTVWLDVLLDRLMSRSYAKDLNLWAYARIDQKGVVSRLPKLRAAGFRWLCYGIESASNNVRLDVGKGGYNTEDITRVVRTTEDAGIEVLANYIVGLPDDDAHTIEQTYALACELNTSWMNVYSAMPYPGSALYEQTARGHREWLPETWDGYSQHSYTTKPLPTKHIGAIDVLRLRDQFHREYFGRADYIDRLRRKFGDGAVDEVTRMLATPVRRKLLGDAPPS
jgi:radical SAM superfamily enzyme YgiQ (UPF0313 family)